MEKSIIKGLRQNSVQCSGHTRPVVDLHFSGLMENNIYYMISASKDGIPMLRFGHTGDWIGSFKGHKGAVWSCTLTSDGRKAATGAADFTAKVWDCEDGRAVRTIDHNHIVRCVEFSADGDKLVSATNKFVVEVHDLKTSENTCIRLNGHSEVIHRTLWLGDDDNKILSVSADKSIRLWDLRSSGEVWKCVLSSPIYDMDVVGGKMVLVCGKEVSVWDVGGPEPMMVQKHVPANSLVLSASLHPSMETFVCGGEDGIVYKHDLGEGGKILDECKAHFGPVHRVRYSPDGRLFASGSEDGTVRLWQNIPGEEYGLWYLSVPAAVDIPAE